MSGDAELDPLLALAQLVAREAAALGVPTAVIGALAMAHHGYVRATVDVDFACATGLDSALRPLAARLAALGLSVELRPPGDDDPLNGVLRVRSGPDGDPVDLVNFAPGASLGSIAVARAEASPDGFRYVRLADLVALKLYAGSRFDKDDVARLLDAASEADRAEVTKVCEELGLSRDLASVAL